MTTGFYCECGIFVPFGTPVKQQIRHIHSQYHKYKMLRKLIEDEDRCIACGRTCSRSFYTYQLRHHDVNLHIKCEHELFSKMLKQHGYEQKTLDAFKRLRKRIK